MVAAMFRDQPGVRHSSDRTRSATEYPPARIRSLTASIYILFVSWILLSTPLSVNGQAFLRNGQFFMKGLAISDAPFPGSPQHAGSSLVIAVELSGNGKIDQSAFIPGSGAPTRYDSLELYLVSSQTGSNFTVSNGSAILTQESGSTVKHLDWPLPPCISPGVYNLTYYESSHINNQAFFSITSINVTVDNPNRSSDTSQCESMTNALQDQPQPDSAPILNPYLDPNSGLAGSVSPDTPIITVGSSGLPTQWTIEPSGSIITVTVAATTATMVVVSTAVLTETTTAAAGQTSVFTTTRLVTTTMTAVMGTADVTAGGFFPVNGAVSIFHILSSQGQSLFVCSIVFFLALVVFI